MKLIELLKKSFQIFDIIDLINPQLCSFFNHSAQPAWASDTNGWTAMPIASP